MRKIVTVLLCACLLSTVALAQTGRNMGLSGQMVNYEVPKETCVKDDLGRCSLYPYFFANSPELFALSRYTGNLEVNLKSLGEWPEASRFISSSFNFLEFLHRPEPTRSGAALTGPFWVNPKSVLVYLKISGAETDVNARMCLDINFQSSVYGRQRLTTICSQTAQGKRQYFEYSQYPRFSGTVITRIEASKESSLSFPLKIESEEWSFRIDINPELGHGSLQIVSSATGGLRPNLNLRLAPPLLGIQRPARLPSSF